MTPVRSITALAAALLVASPSFAAELPSGKKAKPARTESVRHCNIGGVSGVLGANGICVHLGGYVSAGVGMQQVK